jgi:hypothetical protein
MKRYFSTLRSRSIVSIVFALAIAAPLAIAQTFPTVTIYATDSQASEAGSDAGTFTIRRNGPTNFAITVFYHLGGTASNGLDYDQLGGWVQIPAGALTASFNVRPIDDSLVEGDETVVAQITASPLACATCGYDIGVPSTATIVIADNDAGTNHPPGVNIYAVDPNASETASAPNIDPPSDLALFTVRRSDDTNSGIVVFYAISGTASNGIDYQKLSGYVTLPPGVSSANIVVNPIDDNLVEGTETVILTLIPTCPQCLFANPPCDVPEGTNCFQIGPDNRATAYIRDNDTINSSPTVSMVRPTNGAVFEAHSDIPLVAFAQDREDGYFLTVEFFEGGRSLGFGTFFPGRCAVCPNYGLIWSNVPPGEYTLTAKATDSAGASSVSAPVHIMVVESNRPPGVNIYATDSEASEPPALSGIPPDTATFTVRRFDDTNSGIVVFYAISGTASNGVDYQKLSGYVTLPPGVSSANIIVNPIDDNLVEGTETVILTLIPPCPQCLFANPPCDVPVGTNCFQIGPDNQATAYIRDNDPAPTNLPPLVNIVARDPLAVEGQFCWSNWWWTISWDSAGWVTTGGLGYPIVWPTPTNRCLGTNTATFIVHRNGPTNADLTVNYQIGGTASNGVDYEALSGLVTIPAGRGSAQIIVTAIDDSLVEGIETIVLKLQPSPGYAIGFPARAAAIIVDNDRPRPPCALLPDHQFHFCQPATNGYCFRIEASADLLHWSPLCTNIVTDGALHFVDPDAPPLNARFYRAQPEPALPPDN